MSKYRFVKDSNLERPRNISYADYASASYGTTYVYEPQDVPLKIYHFSGSITGSEQYRVLHSLKNTINYYSAQDDLFDYNNYYNKPSALFAFNSYHLGSGIEKGTISINFYISGTLTSSLTDHREDGVLYISGSDEKAGIVLYGEGFILLNHTGALSNETAQFSGFMYDGGVYEDVPRWVYAFQRASDSLYFDIDYGIKNSICTNLNFVYANKNDFNHSNNPTYIESGSYSYSSSSLHFKESEEIKIKKINKSPFISGSAEFEKETYITRIGMYDKDKKLIAIGSLANPVRKTENREYVFKLTFDI